jgi:hypothetical protein
MVFPQSYLVSFILFLLIEVDPGLDSDQILPDPQW